MSYILDALRRADAERERGGVPGLHTLPPPATVDDEEEAVSRSRGLRPWHWIVIGLAAGLTASVAWHWSGPDQAVAEAPPSLPPPPAPAAALPAAPPVLPMAPLTVPAPLPAAPAPAVAIAPQRPVTPTAVAPNKAERRASVASAAASAALLAAASAPAAARNEPIRVSSLAELPADARRSLPPLAFGGSIYSNTPANRLLIVNGQLMHEGDALGPDATLEQIRPKAAVLNIRGQRFEVAL